MQNGRTIKPHIRFQANKKRVIFNDFTILFVFFFFLMGLDKPTRHNVLIDNLEQKVTYSVIYSIHFKNKD